MRKQKKNFALILHYLHLTIYWNVTATTIFFILNNTATSYWNLKITASSSVLNDTATLYWNITVIKSTSVLNDTATTYWNPTVITNSSVVNNTATSYWNLALTASSSVSNDTATSNRNLTVTTISSILNNTATSYWTLTLMTNFTVLNNAANSYWALTLTTSSSEVNNTTISYWNPSLTTSSSVVNNTASSYWNTTAMTSSFVINNTATSTISTTTTTTTAAPPYNPDICNSILQVALPNGSCVSNELGLNVALTILNTSTNAIEKANALILYFSSIENTNTTNILGVDQVDRYLSSLNINLDITSNSSFIMAKLPHQPNDLIILGASFTRGTGGKVIDTQSFNELTSSQLSAAATVSNESLSDVQSLNMIIIDNPSAYTNIDNSTDKKLVSSIIVTNVHRNNISFSTMNISLYFRNVLEPELDVNDNYICSFYDTNTFKWNDSGCSKAQYNKDLNRHECSCNHLTSFALVWLPKQSLTSYYQDTSTSSSTTTTSTTTATTSSTTNINCNNVTHAIYNGICDLKSDIQNETYHVILSNSTDATIIANALSGYISSNTNSNVSSNTANTLSLNEIDKVIDKLNNSIIPIDTTTSFIMVQPPKQQNNSNVIALGASVSENTGGQVVNNLNKDDITKNPHLLTAAIINEELLNHVAFLSIFIIKDPTPFLHVDNSSNKTPASSLVIVSVGRINNANVVKNITLYFQIFNESQRRNDRTYLCSYYNTTTLTWDEAGCSVPTYDTDLNRYECSCNHFTSFALIWLPKQSLTSYLNSQDIASLIFQSISIICLLVIIIHAIFRTIRFPTNTFQIYNLLPLISGATSTILFIFYIALCMTVYTQTSSSDQTKCFTSSTVLMFFTYFFLIFMFCVKTSVGYFNYLRFIHLFPQPSHRKLFIMLFISFFISLIWMIFAIGFYSNSSFNIIKLYPYKLCWFTDDVIYYFLSIPACLFLLINIILFIIVGSRIINHVRHATSVHQSYERMKRCIIVLLSSCITQGIGWLFGVFISFVNGESGYVLGWFFVIFNGLEGLWSIILYMIIRSQSMDEQKHVTAAKKLAKLKRFKAHKYKKSFGIIDENDNDTITKETELYSK
ncbi:unnamed protein product [Adineta steineri]|uniref:Uncharacterized protein n=2 Tax=Adineta steineri TaxID=433720 RepID=A0A814DGY4_9BILA|nr:unnamed protein product [Adineta steineri]